MPVVRRFEFDLSFDAPQHAARPTLHEPEPLPEPEPEPEFVEPPPPPEPSFSQAEIEAAYERGRLEGRQTGEFEAMARIERRLADTSERLCHALQDSRADQTRAVAAIERQAAELSLAALRKLFPALLRRAETQELEAMVTEAFDQALDEPRVVVRAAPTVIDALSPRLKELAERSGYEGKLSLIGDPRLAETDCRMEWSEGGVERDPAKALQAIETAIERGIAALDERGTAALDEHNGPGEPAAPIEESAE
jgi:flagellar assembly protein FliH